MGERLAQMCRFPIQPDSANTDIGSQKQPLLLLKMIASNDSFEPSSRKQLPNSKRIYLNGSIHPKVRVPFREIAQNSTKSINGEVEETFPFEFMTRAVLGAILTLMET